MTDVVPAQRARFDIPHEVAYFNCACKSPLSHRVVAAGEEGVRPKARPWSIEPADCFTDAEVARERVAARINADGIGIVPCASDAIALAASDPPRRRTPDAMTTCSLPPACDWAWIQLPRPSLCYTAALFRRGYGAACRAEYRRWVKGLVMPRSART